MRPWDAGHRLANARWEGAVRSARKPGDLRRPHAHMALVERGWLIMYRIHTARPARRRALAVGAALLCLGVLGVASPSPGSAGAAISVTVRVEGPNSTIVPPTRVTLVAGSAISKDGHAADSCSPLSAAGALQQATAGAWQGTWSKSYKGYLVSGIDGLAFPSTGATYWAFWVNDKPASEGVCGVMPRSGDQLLFFADCYGKSCPPNDGVLGIRTPAVVTAGRAVTVAVTAYADANGKPRPEPGATVRGGGASATTGAGGSATLTFGTPGHYTLRVSAPHAVRTETGVCVELSGSKTCG
jgi:hypothetical protein